MILANFISGFTPWMEATGSDDEFAEFLEDPLYFRTRTPISSAAHDILLRILAVDPAERISLGELRSEIVDVESFFNGDGSRALLEPIQLTQSLADAKHSISSRPSSEYSDEEADGYFVPGMSPSGSSDAGTTHSRAISVGTPEERCLETTKLDTKETTTIDMVERWLNAATYL